MHRLKGLGWMYLCLWEARVSVTGTIEGSPTEHDCTKAMHSV